MSIAHLSCLVGLSVLAPGALGRSVNHNYKLNNVRWSISFATEDRSIAGDVTNTVTMKEDSSTVEFHQINLHVSMVTVNGASATYRTHDDTLTVTLPKLALAGETLNVRAVYTSHPGNGIYFVPDSRAFPSRTGMVYTQGEPEDNRHWLLTYDYPDDKATTEAFITVPKTWTAISNGALIGVQEETKQHVFHWKMDQPFSTYLISFVAGPYVKIHDAWHGIPVDIYVPPGLEAAGKATFGDTPKIMDEFSRLTGVDYPFPKFSQEVVAEFRYAGMENITAVTQTIGALFGPESAPINDQTDLNAHELAHQWFGDLVTCQTWTDEWLNEGFASLMPLYYQRTSRGQEYFDFFRAEMLERAIDSIGGRDRRPVEGQRGSLPGPNVNIGSIYEGGAARLFMLAHLMGEDKFWRGIHDYLKQYEYQGVTTAQFFDVMARSSGINLDQFRKNWFYSPAAPSISAEVKDGALVLSQLSPYYKLDVPVWFWNGANWIKHMVPIEGKEARFPLAELAGKPFLVDPEVWLVMDLKYATPFTGDQVSDMWRHAPNGGAKDRMLRQMFKWLPGPGWTALAAEETNLDALHGIMDRADRSALDLSLRLAKSPEIRRVGIAVDYLNRFSKPPTDTAEAALAEIALQCPNELLRERAIRTILRWTTDPKWANIAWHTTAFADGFRRLALDWYGTHEPETARAKCLMILAHPDNEPLRIQAIRVLGRVKEAPGKHDVFNALVPISKEDQGPAAGAARETIAQLDE